MNIQQTINKFQQAGRFSPAISFSEQDIMVCEKKLGIDLPEDYKKISRQGSFYKSNFHFIMPEFLPDTDCLVVFASWNDALFAFNITEGQNNDYPIYILVGEFIEKRYRNFAEWFEMVYDNATSPFCSE